MNKRYSGFLAFLVLSLIVFYSCTKKESQSVTSLKGLTKSVKVTRRDFRKTVTEYGYIKPLKKVDIVAYNQGRIMNIWAKNGEKIKKGEKLFSINGYYRIKATEELGTSYKESSKSMGENIVIISPISGYVSIPTITLGSAVKNGEILASIVDMKNLFVEIEASSTECKLIKPGQFAKIVSGETQFKGKVSFVSAIISPQTGMQKVGINVLQPDPQYLLPGTFVKVKIIVAQHLAVLAISEKALLNDNGKETVIVKKAKTYEKRAIITGLHDQGYVEVLKGLHKDDEVVTTGAYEILNRNIHEKLKLQD